MVGRVSVEEVDEILEVDDDRQEAQIESNPPDGSTKDEEAQYSKKLALFDHLKDRKETGSSLKESESINTITSEQISELKEATKPAATTGERHNSITQVLGRLIHRDAELRAENFKLKVNIVKDMA